MEGEISKSMGVDTKPAHKFEINGYWLMLDPNADETTVDRIRDFIEACKYADESKQDCLNCKHYQVSANDEPCFNCSLINALLTATNNWEAKNG